MIDEAASRFFGTGDLPPVHAAQHQELFPATDYGASTMVEGTIGWTGEDEFFDRGDATNDGNTLVKVTLFVGAEAGSTTTAFTAPAVPAVPGSPLLPSPPAIPTLPAEPPKPDSAATGHQILCRLLGPLTWLPRPGTRVLVSFPAGSRNLPGSGIILGTIAPTPTRNFGESSAKLDFDKDYDLTIRARSICLRDGQNNSISVSEAGIQLIGADGTNVTVANGEVNIQATDLAKLPAKSIHLSADKLLISDSANACCIKMANGDIVVTTALDFKVQPITGVILLGLLATPATPALAGVSSVAALPSGTVFIGGFP